MTASPGQSPFAWLGTNAHRSSACYAYGPPASHTTRAGFLSFRASSGFLLLRALSCRGYPPRSADASPSPLFFLSVACEGFYSVTCS